MWGLVWAVQWLTLVIVPVIAVCQIKVLRGAAFRRKIAAWSFSVIVPCLSLALMVIASAKLSQHSAKASPTNINQSGDWVDYRGQIHAHSRLSHDSQMPLGAIARACQDNKIDWILLTDHISRLPEEESRAINGVVFIYGSERGWNKQGSHFRAPIDGPEQFHAYGHIEQFKNWDGERWDAIELVNFHANTYRNFGSLLENVFFHPSKVYQALTVVLPQNLDYWQKLAEREQRPIPIFAGPDAHQNVRLLGAQLDPYKFMLGLVSTHIWIKKGEPLNQETILGAIKSGRTYIAFDYLGDPTGFQFWAETDDQQRFSGDAISQPDKLRVRIPKGSGIKLRLYRDRHASMWLDENYIGEKDLSGWIDPENFFYAIPYKGFWRVEVWRDGKPWIISGQILVK